jgi:hypothetical protein
MQSPIDAPGKHGATGDFAFAYYPGEGTNVPWAARAMAAGVDYLADPESYADVVNAGWYTWDMTDLVRRWARGEQPNYGLVLRDATGYQDDHRDWRTFIASQATVDPTLRPKLTVVFNPDVPYADAGPDQANLTWDGGAVALDGSASHDRPGGDDASLQYAWRIVEAAYGSALSGPIQGSTATLSFTPDIPGEWEIELTVTNNLSESASDRVHLRLLRIPATHPRIYLTPTKLAALQARALPANPRWVQLQAEADDPSGEMHAKALVAQITGQTAYCDQAIAAALSLVADPYDHATRTGDIALVYDWCYARLTAEQRTTLINYFNTWADDLPKGNDSPGWGNYWPRWGYSYALAGLATYGDAPRAQEWLDEYRYNRFRDSDLPLLDRIAEGGGWPEGMIYDWIANWPRAKAIDAWRTATGEDLFASTAWFRQRLGYILLHRWPGVAEQWGNKYHPYLSTGDTERNRGSIANYDRIMALILIERFPEEPLARQLQAYLATPPVNNSQSFLYHEEFLWFNPDQPTEPPTPLTHYTPSLGTIFMRSDWPDGAADTDPSATYLTFQAGDHFTYHQHFDQNSFTLFKRGDLALDSGVYSGDGLSDHDINYYVRTIAHNTLIVDNPDEDFQHARPDATSNDGGQRSVYPASRSPQDLEYFDTYATQYDTGDMARFEDGAAYTYALGDATKAYNNPTYNQTMDTSMSGNVAKVSRFQREFVYLRPMTEDGGRTTSSPSAVTDDYVVLFDRVGVTQPAFSGANTKLLFHILNEPVVNGAATVVSSGETLYTGADLATTTSGEGKLFIKTLLPAARNLRVVGGRGIKSFWVFDRNYDWQWSPGEPQPRPINDFEDVPYGEWRIEMEPADTALEHNFLTVLYPAPSSAAAMPATTLVTADGLSGALIADPQMNRLALFSAASDGSAPDGTLLYTYQPTTRTLNILFDLLPGARYQLDATFEGGIQTVTLTSDAGGLYAVSDQGVLSFVVIPGGPIVLPTVTPTPTSTATPTITPTVTRTATPTSTGEATPTVTSTVTPTATATPTVRASLSLHVYLPLVLAGASSPTLTPTATSSATATITAETTATATTTATPEATTTATPTATSGPSPTATPTTSCAARFFPADNIWNTRVDTLPVDARSRDYVNNIGATAGLHPDFGSGLWEGRPMGIPYTTVPGSQPRVAMTFGYEDESDPGPYPIPTDAPIEGGPASDGDRHVLVVDRDGCQLYETWDSWPTPDGSWYAGSGAVFDLQSNALRPQTWTSADAAGLPILPGLVRYDEVASGAIRHALRFTVPNTRREFIWPARHFASSSTDPNRPPMGQRFRLKADFDIAGFSATNQVILTALKEYGMFVADNGSSWFLSGAPDARWDNDDLHHLQDFVHGSDFEAVDESALMVDPDSGQALPPP